MPSRGRRPRGDDDGAIHVLEAVIFAILILFSVAFVVTFEVPTTQHEAFLTDLWQIATDSLNVLAGNPPHDPNSPFPTRLEQYVGEALMGDDANLTDYLDKYVPLGRMYRLTLETENGTLHVAGAESPPPFTYPVAAAQHPLRLRPSGAYLQSEFGVQDGLHPLRPMAVVVENGTVEAPTGIPVEVRVTFTNGTEPRTHASVHTTSRPSSLGGVVPSASLHFADANDDAIGHVRLDAAGTFAGRLVLNESGDEVPVPAGTGLTVRVPSGWSDIACLETTAWYGCDIVQEQPRGPATITSKLLNSVRDREVAFPFRANYTDQGPTRLPFSTWRAELSGRAASVAELLVAPIDNHLVQASSAIVGVTLPKPLGDVGPSQLVVSFGNGRISDLTVTRIEVDPLDDIDLFQSPTGNGWQKEDRRLVWSGNQHVAARKAHDFNAQITANPVLGSGSYQPSLVSFEFDNDFAPDLARFRHTGVFKDLVPATTVTSPGYPQFAGSHWMRTREGAFGNVTLTVAPLPESALMSELYDAHVTSRLDVTPKEARAGQTVTLTADFTGMMETLVDYGNVGDRNVSVTTNVYDPVSFLRKVPWMTYETPEEALGHPPIWSVEVVDANGDGTTDLVLAKGTALYALDGKSADYDARLWKRTYAGNANGLLAIADVDGDGEAEVLVVTAHGEIEVVDVESGGVEQAYALNDGVTAAALGGDCDDDGRPEILLGTVESTGQVLHDGPTFVGFDDLDPSLAENVHGWLHVLESDGTRLLPRKAIDLGLGTKVRDFAHGTLTKNHVCGFVTAEANGDVTAYDGSSFAPLWTHEAGVPYERGGATQVLVLETDPEGHPDYGVPEVVYGDGEGWVTALNSTRPAPVPTVLDLTSLLGGDKLVDVDMVSEDVGYAISEKGLVFKTTDGWVTAIAVPSSLGSDLAQRPTTVEAFDFYDENRGIVATANKLLFFTETGGTLFEWDEDRELPGPAKELQFYAPDAAVAAVDSAFGLVEILKDPINALQPYDGWPGAGYSLWIDEDGHGLVAGPDGSAGTFFAGQPARAVDDISLSIHRNLASILRHEDQIAATDDDGHVFYRNSTANTWTRENLTSSPEVNLTWVASSTGANLQFFNLNGERGYGLADRSARIGSYRTQVSLEEPFVGVSRAADGLVAAATANKIVAFPDPMLERRWSFSARGSVESLEVGTNGLVGTSRLGTFHLDSRLGNGAVITSLHGESLANFGRLRWLGSDVGWVAGTYLVGDGAVPVPIEPLPGRTDFTLQSNLVERYDAANQLAWTQPLPQQNEMDSLAFALGDWVLVGQRGGSLLKLRVHDGHQGGSSYPGDLTGTVVIPLHLPGQLLYGPYIAESQLRVRLGQAGEDVVQSATVVNHFLVTPEGGPFSPRIYDVHLLIWPTV